MSESSNNRPDWLSPQECHETVDPATREAVFDEYSRRCRVCGRRDQEKGGLAKLQVHHIERNLDGMDEHDIDNLTLLCRSCHSYFHQQTTSAVAPVEITAEEQTMLLPQDIEILQ
ncbi:HNH endonuclease [Natronoarchaeum sp. GCM10025703]|uniref:HNH endonuclease n=1 Tax=unclassified Natronoarchaeum TaxID=2620183 RepID=UPI0036123AE1